jgi:chorismate lyase/3-hydroxybenzoate synthase
MTASEANPVRHSPQWPARPYAIVELAPAELSAALSDRVLCQVIYGNAASSVDAADDPRRVVAPLQPLTGTRGAECWLSPTPVRSARAGRFAYAENDTVMMLSLRVAEADLSPLEDSVRSIYAELIKLIEARGYPHLLRIWNYLGDINRGEGDAERYRQFCLGRFAAIARPGFETQLPAASAIGSRGSEGFTLIVLASKHAGIQVENPRQLSAFRYPRVYGERSPSFSRATLLPWADGAELLVSGTASIVGHATAHAGDALAQLRQTAANLEALRTHAMQMRKQAGVPIGELRPHCYLLYLRHAEDLPTIAPAIKQLFGDAPLQVLIGDICRSELLLEVEAIYRSATEPAKPC